MCHCRLTLPIVIIAECMTQYASIVLIMKCIIVCLTMYSLSLFIATFRQLTASLLLAVRSTDYAAPFVSRRSAVIDPSLFRREVIPSAVRYCTVQLLLCFFIVGTYASEISIPLSMLMLLG